MGDDLTPDLTSDVLAEGSVLHHAKSPIARVTALDIPEPDRSALEPRKQSYFAKCEAKLGFVPNVLRAHSFHPEKLDTFINLYNHITLLYTCLICRIAFLHISHFGRQYIISAYKDYVEEDAGKEYIKERSSKGNKDLDKGGFIGICPVLLLFLYLIIR